VSELVGAVLTRPTVDIERAAAILAEHWHVDGGLSVLPSERDRNFAVMVDGRNRFVLKIANATEDPAFLDLQHQAMERLAAAGVPCQLPVSATDGRAVIDVGSAGHPALARLLTWLPGRSLATIPPADRSAMLLRDLGLLMGRTVSALAGFDHPAAHREFQWDASLGLTMIEAHASAVSDAARAALLARWQVRLRPLDGLLPGLRHGVIHNDANDHNVLVADDGSTVSGLLDLGDAVFSIVVAELSVAAAYAALGASDPLATIDTVRAGFEEIVPLEGVERRILVELVALRLATSVALSAHQSRLDPGDPYLTVSEGPAWDILARLIDKDPAGTPAALGARP
jgi:Ser/Thr protein kinase RdoA (MazF antagonist)